MSKKEKESKVVIVAEIQLMAHSLNELSIQHPAPLTEKANRKDLKNQRDTFQQLLDDAAKLDDDKDDSSNIVDRNENSIEGVLAEVEKNLPDTRNERVNGAEDKEHSEDTRLNNEIVYVPGLLYLLSKSFDPDTLENLCRKKGLILGYIPRNQKGARTLDDEHHEDLAKQLRALEELSVQHLGLPFLDEAYGLAKDILDGVDNNQLESFLSKFEKEDQEFARELSSCKLHEAAREIFYKFPRAKLQAVRAKASEKKTEEAHADSEKVEKKAKRHPIQPSIEPLTRREKLARRCSALLAVLPPKHPVRNEGHNPSNMDEVNLEALEKDINATLAAHYREGYERSTVTDARVANVQKKMREELERVQKEMPSEIRIVWDGIIPPLRVAAANFFPGKVELQKDDHLPEVVEELIASHKEKVRLEEQLKKQTDNLHTAIDQRNVALNQCRKAGVIAESRVSSGWKRGSIALLLYAILVSCGLGVNLINSTSASAPESKSNGQKQEAPDQPAQDDSSVQDQQAISGQPDQSEASDSSLQELNSLLQKIEEDSQPNPKE